MATLRDLAARLNNLADNAERLADEAKARVALAIVKQLVQDTPVDTSQALSNWRVGTGSTPPPIPPYYAGVQGSTRDASIGAAIAAAEAAIAANKSADVLVIFNAVPYIRRLNDGSSAQAPAGFIERAVLAGRLAARRK